MKYYAFEFRSGRHTTTGEPNKKTGRLSIAGNLVIFASKEKRDAWVDAGKTTSDMQGNCRESVTRTEARNLNLGASMSEHIEYVEFWAE
jgi:hypothetical protein